eukprot:scaffold187110_cov23-Tisochrysis_lutea.AAC.1
MTAADRTGPRVNRHKDSLGQRRCQGDERVTPREMGIHLEWSRTRACTAHPNPEHGGSEKEGDRRLSERLGIDR